MKLKKYFRFVELTKKEQFNAILNLNYGNRNYEKNFARKNYFD